MREHDLLAPSRFGRPHGPRAHDGTIPTERVDDMWGTDLILTMTAEGQASIFVTVDHASTECLGIHAARRATRFEALEAIMAAYVGLDPRRDFEWVTSPDSKPMEVFAKHKADAFLAFPPEPQELRDRQIGRVIVSTIQDQPWSQYLCCVLFSCRQFVREGVRPLSRRRGLADALSQLLR
jgi:hypothetical protein